MENFNIYDIKLPRTRIIDGYKYDDVKYVCTLLYAICVTSGIEYKRLVQGLQDDDVDTLLNAAEYLHSFPFQEAVVDTASDYFGIDLERKSVCKFSKAWNDSGIFARLIAYLAIVREKRLIRVFRDVYCSELGNLLMDTTTAWPITPANMLLVEAEKILKY